MASYASEVKKELTGLEVHPEHARVELSALIRMNGSLSLQNHHFVLTTQTENPAIARRIFSLIKQKYGMESELLVRKKMKLKKNNQYLVRLKRNTNEVLQDLGILDETGLSINTDVTPDILNEDQRMRSYLRGAFLATGSVNNPETSRYHLEIYSLYESHNEDIAEMMNHFGLNARTTKRRNGYIVYLKEAERIADFLQLIGATNAMLKFEDIRIVRDMRNSVNRLVNCENANINKTVAAAERQVENIKYLRDTIGLDSLPQKLQEIATLRLDNPEVSLKELGEMVPSGAISKSGINHRLRKLNQMAEEAKV
ncbi:DNA-binding protein WhiA [Companilactobacillus sp.]|jgi:DNA-binding protein WhiA|uniref:DNA-binding protein WhiA n=1 Tax=Companilactobacillus sp. TaxID=2767905 RepID=UPI0025BBE16E|nr:DNA-binding protein WhiA [Companilactobacillus sp.]MCH4008778.1 DNA-binding protein WhiA [Companilactobacillus sp.]MCH4051043.1 DNA-binding protein WhiA [Companilactobacillus sp.]MCH4076721.1 DNA-binding protein WhiA [Companilactobacillus sp.]MCH4125296.1 DNA-binding protein WhiA [Companilactobacillus sp.]MCH4131836.1 DNA-binding protein WhiA [Companilactobacillus sp.]